MKKTGIVFIAVIIFIAMLLNACDTVDITIHFNSNGGSEVAPIRTRSLSISIPDNPVKEGYEFDGWFWDNETFNKSFTANSLMDAPIRSDMTVYAKWVPKQNGNPNSNKPNIDDNQEEDMNPKVIINLEDGRKIRLELYPEIAPISVANFLKLVDDGYYTNVVFHRIINDFMIQTGMLEFSNNSLTHKPEQPTIKGEFSDNGVVNNLKHEIGVISMARTTVMNSASAQFFICSANSANVKNLDGKYAAFGKTIDEESNQVVISLSQSVTGTFSGMQNFPVIVESDGHRVIVISSIERM